MSCINFPLCIIKCKNLTKNCSVFYIICITPFREEGVYSSMTNKTFGGFLRIKGSCKTLGLKLSWNCLVDVTFSHSLSTEVIRVWRKQFKTTKGDIFIEIPLLHMSKTMLWYFKIHIFGEDTILNSTRLIFISMKMCSTLSPAYKFSELDYIWKCFS